MKNPIVVHCEKCGGDAELVNNVRMNVDGTCLEWPKATVRSGALFFTINCKKCGELEQRMAQASDTN